MNALRPVISVWSAYGHVFMGDGDGNESCLTCGAEYTLRNLGDGYGEYVADNGDAPTECSGRSDLAHGTERVCQADNGKACADNADTGNCAHTDFPCNCRQCD